MAKNIKKNAKKNTAPLRKTNIAPEIMAIAAAFLAALIFISLISYTPKDPSFFNETANYEEVHNYLGLLGSYGSSLLVAFFGLWSFWPVVFLMFYGWHCLKPRRLSSLLCTITGSALFLFAAMALSSVLWPNLETAFPGQAGGGWFGSFLATGLIGFLGKVGGYVVLPLLAFLGFCLIFGNPLPTLMKILIKTGQEPPAPAPAVKAKPLRRTPKGLDLHPQEQIAVIEKERPEPKIVERTPKSPQKSLNKEETASAPSKEIKGQYVGGPYVLPSSELLDTPAPGSGGHASGLSRTELMANARLLEEKLLDFGVDGRVLEVSGGPVITMYEYQPAPGIKISKVAGLADDLTMAMRAIAIRVVAPLPGKAAIGLELPNPKRSLVTLREVIDSPAFQASRSPLSMVLGVDIMGNPQVADLAKMPHLLIAGATGSGKSVGLGAMIMSILSKASPDQVRFLMIDPKCVELALYKDIPHLIYPVLSDPTEATLGLKWAVAEMDLRYKLLAEKGVRNIEGYNEKIREELKTWKRRKTADGQEEAPPKELFFLVIIIDELADLMMVAAKEVEVYITRLAQKARAAGIHLILATQRPSVDVLTGVIKANMPTRISFQVTSKIDSRTILDQMGAEKLLGAGDMLFMPPGIGKLKRLHGAYVSDDEIKRVTDFIRSWGPPDYLEDLSLPDPDDDENFSGEKDEKYDEAVELVRRTQKATISHVQRHLRIGYNRAARIIEDMEREGIIGPADGTRPRVIL